jgi:hypothetical protein
MTLSASETPKAISPKKIEANRRNALKSTGPKTANGKSTVSRNAAKHSILAKEVLESEPAHEAASFRELLAQLTQEYQPANVTEKLLVERIASCWWRLKRVIRAENGEVSKELVASLGQQVTNSDEFREDLVKWMAMRAEWDLMGRIHSGDPVRDRIAADEEVIRNLQRTYTGILAVTGVIRSIKEAVAKEDSLPEERVRSFLEWFGMEGLFRIPLDGKWETPEQRKNFIDHLDAKLAELEQSAESLLLKRTIEKRAQFLSASLPPENVAGKIVRYEAHIDRQLYRAIDQLERIQRRRKGEVVPPPLKLSVEHSQS